MLVRNVLMIRKEHTARLLWIILLLVPGLLAPLHLAAQKIPSKPLSNVIYSPLVINPAIGGSKDFTAININSSVLKSPNNQLFSFHKRKTEPLGSYSRFGFGSYLFNEKLEGSRNTGLAVTGAYHISLDQDRVHNVAVGAALKGIVNLPSGEGESGDSASTFNPNADFGIYYYGPSGFAGISTTSLFGTQDTAGTLYGTESYVPREYHLYGGYKFVLSRKNSIVLEPSLLLSLNDSTFSSPQDHITPFIKLYMENFYVGTYYKSLDHLALFFQYHFPRFYAGVFLEFPRVGFLNDDNIIFEINLGVNLGKNQKSINQHTSW